MNENVALGGDPLPRDVGMSGTKLGSQTVGSFADDLDRALDCSDQNWVLSEGPAQSIGARRAGFVTSGRTPCA